MNWSEHLHMLHRLTGHNYFNFGTFAVTYDYVKGEFIFWSRQAFGFRVTDAELVSIIASYGEVELERVS